MGKPFHYEFSFPKYGLPIEPPLLVQARRRFIDWTGGRVTSYGGTTGIKSPEADGNECFGAAS